MSVLPPKADIHRSGWNVRFVPIRDIVLLANVDGGSGIDDSLCARNLNLIQIKFPNRGT
jgi:hypothetical protein